MASPEKNWCRWSATPPESGSRSATATVASSTRAIAVYLFTHKVDVALGFMIVSNIYTTVGYFVHERIWARIKWGAAPTAS